jgi:hypothetical protein
VYEIREQIVSRFCTKIFTDYFLELMFSVLFKRLYNSVRQVSVGMIKQSYTFVQLFVLVSSVLVHNISGKPKAILVQAWTGP